MDDDKFQKVTTNELEFRMYVIQTLQALEKALDEIKVQVKKGK